MVITIKHNLSGETFPVDVQSKDTVLKLKNIIQQQKGFPVKQQRLLWAGKPLKDEEAIEKYDIPDENLVYLVVQQAVGGSTQDLHVVIPEKDFESVKLDVYPYEDIGAVKKMIEEKTKIPVDQQDLFYKQKSLDQTAKLSDLQIPAKASLELRTKPKDNSIRITVKMPIKDSQDYRYQEYEVLPTDKISNLKTKIKEKEKILESQQRLFFQTKILKEDMELQQCGITNGTTIQMMPLKTSNSGMNIFVENTKGDLVALNLNPQDSVAKLENIINQSLLLTSKDRILYTDGRRLNQSTQSLSSQGVNDESVIEMRTKISVKDMKSYNTTYYVSPTSTISQLKEKIQDETGINPNTITLVHGNKTLRNSASIMECGIKEQDVLNLVHRYEGA